MPRKLNNIFRRMGWLAALIFLLGSCKTVQPQAKKGQVVLATVDALTAAVQNVQPGDEILLKDGDYKNVKLVIVNSGTAGKPIRIAAQHPGAVFFTGDVAVELRGEHLILDGIFFKNGTRNPAEWKSHGPGLVAMYGSHNRVTNCAFDAFDEANSAWITTSIPHNGNVPQYCRIDHCSFTNKLTFDQVINLNNTRKQSADSTLGGPPMYHRVDHNFFSNPPKPGNAGGGIRIGYYRYDVGRCLVDSNLFVRQDSEAEIITSKSQENVYYANTFLNCQGTLNFRHGDHQVAINNFFIGTDSAFGYGGMFVWGSRHTIGANYFNLPRTIKSRGNAALYLNPGAPGTEHALAFDILIANNAFIANGGYAVHFNPLDKQRKELSAKNGWPFETPHAIHFVGNLFYGNSPCAYSFFRNDYPGKSAFTWQGNVARGCPLGITVSSGITEMSCPLQKEGAVFLAATCRDYHPATVQGIRSIEGIRLDFNALIRRGVLGKPLVRAEVGPAWKPPFPSYAQKGVLPLPLQEIQQRIIAQSSRANP